MFPPRRQKEPWVRSWRCSSENVQHQKKPTVFLLKFVNWNFHVSFLLCIGCQKCTAVHFQKMKFIFWERKVPEQELTEGLWNQIPLPRQIHHVPCSLVLRALPWYYTRSSVLEYFIVIGLQYGSTEFKDKGWNNWGILGALYLVDRQSSRTFSSYGHYCQNSGFFKHFGTFVSTADENFFVGQCRFFSFCKRMLHKNRKTNNSLNETFTRDCF